MFPILRIRRSRDMAKVLPFVPKPAPLFSRKRLLHAADQRRRRRQRELIKQLEDKEPQKVKKILERLEKEQEDDGASR